MAKQFSREEILKNMREKIARKEALLVCGCGTGLIARLCDQAGLSSNTVTASIIIPIIIALATTYNLPMMGIVIPACLTLSLAFILVTSTPTSILPYSYGYFTITDMAKSGTVLTLLSSGILTLVIYSIGLLSGIY